jgi:AcrR family transcriptional regulator
MASPVAPDALAYTAKDWLKYGPVEAPSTREKMIMLAIEDIITVGPADFNAFRVCDRIDIKHPMVNYYFGNRDGLLAEATWWAYQEWSKNVRRSMREAPADPEKRLRAFIEEECAWAERMGGMYLLLQYPLASAGSHVIVSENYGEKMQDIFDYHLALLTTTIVDLRSGKLSSLDFDEDSVPTAALLLHPAEVIASGHVAWMTHGLASWSTGQHTATRKMPTRGIKGLTVGIARSAFVDQIVKVARGK